MFHIKTYIAQNPIYIYISLTVFIILMGFFIGISSSQSIGIIEKYTPQIDLIAQIQFNVSVSKTHTDSSNSLLTESNIKTAIKHFNKALYYTNSLLRGSNNNSFMVVPLNNKIHKSITDSIEKKILSTINILEAKQSSISQKNIYLENINYQTTMDDIIEMTNRLRESLTSHMNKELSGFNQSKVILLISFVILSFILITFIGFFIDKQKKTINEITYTKCKLEELIQEVEITKEELKDSEERFRSLINQSPFSIEMYDLSGTLVLANSAWESLTGNDSKSFIGKYNIFNDKGIIDSDQLTILSQAFNGDFVSIPKSKFLNNSNHKVSKYISMNFYPVKNSENEINYIVIIKEDITNQILTKEEIKKAEISKQNHKNSYSEIFNAVDDIIYIQDENGKFLSVNNRAEEIYGYETKEFIGKTPEFISAPGKNDLKNVKKLIKKTFDGEPQKFEFWAKNKKGDIFPKEIRLNKGTYMGKDVIIAFAQDITDQKQSELELKKLAAFANLNPSPVLRFNDRGLITYVNTVSYIIFNENDIIEKHVSDLLPFLDSVKIKDYIKNDKIKNFEYKVCGLDFVFCVQGVSDLNVGHIYGTEITDRKKAEQKMAHAKDLAEASDNIKSEFLAQMSHEIRTPINTILSFSSLIKEELESEVEDDLKSSFQGITNAGRRIIRTIDLLLNMSEVQTGSYEVKNEIISFNDNIFDQMLDEFKFMATEKGLELKVVKPEEDVRIYGDKYSIQQICANLIDNAIKYTNEGQVTIKLYKTITAVCLEIIDTGIGISEEYLPNLFKQFSQEDRGYTRQFEGNGLGLALVKHYCNFNKATISVNSKKGYGSTFKVVFPFQQSDSQFKLEDHI